MTTKVKDLIFVVTPEISQVDLIMELADKHHWVPPEVIGDSGMIEAPVIDGLWRYEPLIDTSIIPRSARRRLKLVLKSIPVQGFIVGHELEIETKPKVKPLPWRVAPEEKPEPQIQPLPWRVAPEEAPKPRIRPWSLPDPQKPEKEIDWGKVGHITWSVVKVIGIVLGAILVILAACMGAAVGCATDPTVIVVTEDGKWVEIFRYYS